MRRTTTWILFALALTACGAEDPVTVDRAWSRVSVPGQTQGVVYFDLTVADDDVLLGASVPADIAGAATLHESVADDVTDDASGMDMGSGGMDRGSAETGDPGAMMRMQELVDGLTVDGGETVAFEPGSYHVMLTGLVDPLEEGDEFELTLEFAEADAVTVTVDVSETAP